MVSRCPFHRLVDNAFAVTHEGFEPTTTYFTLNHYTVTARNKWISNWNFRFSFLDQLRKYHVVHQLNNQ